MKFQYLLAGCLAASMTFFGCGDSSSGSGSGVDREDVSSSGDGSKSSSSTKKDSSSNTTSSSKGSKSDGRAATLDDLSKNMVLDVDGHEVHLSTGTKQGLFTFWVLGKGTDPDTGRVVVISDFEDGVISLEGKNAAPAVITTLGTDYFLYKMAKSKKISFVVDPSGTLLYSVDGGDKKAVETEQVTLGKSTINKMEELVGKAITCKSDDTTEVFKFYNGRFVWNHREGKKETFAAGYADIQRSSLLMMPIFHTIKSLPQILLYSVSSKYDLGLGECSAESFKYTEIDKADLMNSWYSYDSEKNLDWNLALSKDMTFSMRSDAEEVLKQGTWDVYGDELFMSVTACNDPETCESAFGGIVDDLEKNKGFTYNHSNKETPAVPTEWVIPEVE